MVPKCNAGFSIPKSQIHTAFCHPKQHPWHELPPEIHPLALCRRALTRQILLSRPRARRGNAVKWLTRHWPNLRHARSRNEVYEVMWLILSKKLRQRRDQREKRAKKAKRLIPAKKHALIGRSGIPGMGSLDRTNFRHLHCQLRQSKKLLHPAQKEIPSSLHRQHILRRTAAIPLMVCPNFDVTHSVLNHCIVSDFIHLFC
jgi:hypothetical protein